MWTIKFKLLGKEVEVWFKRKSRWIFFPLIQEQDYGGMNYTTDIQCEEPWKDSWDVEKAQWTDLDYLLNAGTQK